MNAFAVVLIVIGAVLLLLFLGGLAANARRTRARDAALTAKIAAANSALADAHASDKGWDPVLLEQAARDAFAARSSGAQAEELQLVQVVDKPGTDADEAVFRIVSGGAEHTVTLGRRDGAWVAL